MRGLVRQNSVLNNKGFLSLWAGSAISELGGAFGTFCNSILVYELTGSKLALGSMWLLYYIPSIILQLISGPFIDRWSRKRIMIFSQWTRAFIFLLPLIALTFGMIEVWHIYVVQLVIGLITPFYVPASQSITPTIVAKEQLPTANAVLDGTTRLMLFCAPILGGIIIESMSVRPTLVMVCILLTLSGFLLLSVEERRVSSVIRSAWIAQFQEGIHYFFTERTIVWLGFFLAFVQFGVGVTMIINLPYITDELQGSYQEYGLFMAGFPLGYVLGSIIVGKLPAFSRRKLMLGALVIGGFTYILLGFTTSIVLAIIVEVIAGIVMAIFSIHNLSICQRAIPNHLMGKVMSVRLAIIRTAMPVGILTGGIASEILGIRPLFITIGLIIVTVSMIGFTMPYFRFIDDSTKRFI